MAGGIKGGIKAYPASALHFKIQENLTLQKDDNLFAFIEETSQISLYDIGDPLLVMFLISVLSGLMGIIFGYKRFYDDFLSKSITLPVYAYLIILFVVALAIIFWPAIKNRPKGLQTIKGESFGVQRIFVDGKRFVNCKFSKTELVYTG